MALLQSDECFYNGANAASKTFSTTLVIHIIFLFELINILFVLSYYICKSNSFNMVYYFFHFIFK